MKKIILSVFLLLGLSVFSNVFAQSNVPSVADNASPVDNNIKTRSIELERAKREDARIEAEEYAPINKKLESKFPEIKEDFEGIQISQNAIISAYTQGKTIDYKAIESAANEVNKKAKRLDSNLFAENAKQLKDDSKKKDQKTAAIRDLIVELDNAVGSFVSSDIFKNPKVIEAEVALKARKDLARIQELSAKLAEEAKKMQ